MTEQTTQERERLLTKERERFLKNIDATLAERQSVKFTGKVTFEANLSQGGLVEIITQWQHRQWLKKKEA